MKRLRYLVASALLLLCVLPIAALAWNANPHEIMIQISLADMPEGTQYVDLLVP